MIGRRNNSVWRESNFYRDSYYKMLRALMVTILIMLCLIGAIIYSVLSRPTVPYYVTTTNGQTIPITPMQ